MRNVRQKFHLDIRILPPLEKSKQNLDLIDDVSVLGIAPWTLSVPTVRFDLTKFKKDTTDPETYKQLYLKLVSEFPSSDKGVAAAAVSSKRLRKTHTCSLPDDSSIYCDRSRKKEERTLTQTLIVNIY